MIAMGTYELLDLELIELINRLIKKHNGAFVNIAGDTIDAIRHIEVLDKNFKVLERVKIKRNQEIKE